MELGGVFGCLGFFFLFEKEGKKKKNFNKKNRKSRLGAAAKGWSSQLQQ
jgi:hypothetical protein